MNDVGNAGTLSPEQLRLEQYFARRYQDCEAWISDFARAPSGFSNETRFFKLHLRKGGETRTQSLVARWAPAGADRQFEDYDIAFQYKAMSALADTAISVPKLVLLERDASVLGGPFFVMEKVEGDITSDYPPGSHGAGFLFEATPSQRAAAWWRSLEVTASLNRLDWRRPGFAFLDAPQDGRQALERRLLLMRRLLEGASKVPIEPIERALAWLKRRIPAAADRALCWSDARPGNIIFRDFEPVAALDWEGLHIAPPENDLAYFILVDEVAYRSYGVPRLEGLPSTAETISRYEQLLGRKADSLDYYFVMQGTWLAIAMVNSLRAAAAKGITGFPEDYATNNVAIGRLNELLADAS